MISTLEQFASPSLLFGFFNFDEVNINKISRIIYIQSFTVFVNQGLIKCKHFFTILRYLFLCSCFSGKILKLYYTMSVTFYLKSQVGLFQ